MHSWGASSIREAKAWNDVNDNILTTTICRPTVAVSFEKLLVQSTMIANAPNIIKITPLVGAPAADAEVGLNAVGLFHFCSKLVLWFQI